MPDKLPRVSPRRRSIPQLLRGQPTEATGCKGDVLLDGKAYDAKSKDRTLWEVKTGDFADCNPHFIHKLKQELYDDLRRAVKCNLAFKILVTEPCVCKALAQTIFSGMLHCNNTPRYC